MKGEDSKILDALAKRVTGQARFGLPKAVLIINAIDITGNTAMSIAKKKGYSDVIHLLNKYKTGSK